MTKDRSESYAKRQLALVGRIVRIVPVLAAESKSLYHECSAHLEANMTGRTFKASVRKGRLEPRKPLEFGEGTELVVTVEEVGESGTVPEPRNIWAGYNPDDVIAALRENADAVAGVDRERLIADIHKAREQGSRGRLYGHRPETRRRVWP